MTLWKPTVDAYESELEVLEAGRAELHEAAEKISNTVAERLRSQTPQVKLPEGVSVDVKVERDAGVAQVVTNLCVLVRGSVWAMSSTYLAGAFGGPKRTLRVASTMIVTPRDALPWDASEIWSRARRALGLALAAEPGDPDLEPFAIHAAAIAIDQGPCIDVAASACLQQATALIPYAVECAETAALIQKTKRALLRCKQRLEQSRFCDGHAVNNPGKGLQRDDGHFLVWLEHPKPSVWIGTDPRTQEIFYAHEPLPGANQADAFRQRVKGHAPRRDSNDYAMATLYDRAAVQHASEDAIANACHDAFQIFAELNHPKRTGAKKAKR